jgi:hypothetical protein
MTTKRRKVGRWVVTKTPDAFNPRYPWKVTLWGGNGEHWADGAEVETWAEAWDIARQATVEYDMRMSFYRHYSTAIFRHKFLS